MTVFVFSKAVPEDLVTFQNLLQHLQKITVHILNS